MTIKAVIYARFSPRPDEDESQSNVRQIECCKEYAAKMGYEVSDDRIFQDEALTGADDAKDPDPLKAIENRPGLMNSIKATRKGMVLLVRWRARISREPYIQEYVERVLHAGNAFIEASDEDNGTGIASRLYRSFKAEEARDYVERIRFLTRTAMQRHQKNGRRMGRPDRIPFGYKAKPYYPAEMIVDEGEQQTIKTILDLRAQGLCYNAICTALDAQGIPRRGKVWKNAFGFVRDLIKRYASQPQERESS